LEGTPAKYDYIAMLRNITEPTIRKIIRSLRRRAFMNWRTL
jgi:hypothetical protein